MVLYDAGNKALQKDNLSGQEITVNRGNLSAGLYMDQLMQNGKVLAASKVIFE